MLEYIKYREAGGGDVPHSVALSARPPFPRILCFRSGKAMDAIKYWLGTRSVAAQHPKVPEEKATQSEDK